VSYNSMKLRSQVGLQLRKTLMMMMMMMMCTSVGLEKVLEHKSISHRESRSLCVKKIISHGLMSIQNY